MFNGKLVNNSNCDIRRDEKEIRYWIDVAIQEYGDSVATGGDYKFTMKNNISYHICYRGGVWIVDYCDSDLSRDPP